MGGSQHPEEESVALHLESPDFGVRSWVTRRTRLNWVVELVENWTRQVDSHVELFEAHQEGSDATGHSGKGSQGKSKNETNHMGRESSITRGLGHGATMRLGRMQLITTMVTSPQEHLGRRKQRPPRKKCFKAKAKREASPVDLSIQPNEPTHLSLQSVILWRND